MMRTRIQQINWNLDSVSWKTQHPTPDIADLSIPKCQVHLLRIYLLQQTWDSFSFHLWVTSNGSQHSKKVPHFFFHFWKLTNYSSSISFGPYSHHVFPPPFVQNSRCKTPKPPAPGGRSITTHDLKLVFLSTGTVLQTENNKWKIMYPKGVP